MVPAGGRTVGRNDLVACPDRVPVMEGLPAFPHAVPWAQRRTARDTVIPPCLVVWRHGGSRQSADEAPFLHHKPGSDGG